MKQLLINGCSYAVWWKNYHQLSDRLGFESCVNLGMNGSSNDRIFRTTVDYIIKNPQVEFVVLMTTFINRFEAPWARHKDGYEGFWVSYSPQGLTGPNLEKLLMLDDAELRKINKFIEDRYVLDLTRHGYAYNDKFFTNLIQLTGWLQSQNIKYCIFNACEDLIEHSVKLGIVNLNNVEYLTRDPRIIDIRTFMSNQYMYEQGAVIRDEERQAFDRINIPVDPRWVHYGEDGYTKLNDFLYNYITDKCL